MLLNPNVVVSRLLMVPKEIIMPCVKKVNLALVYVCNKIGEIPQKIKVLLHYRMSE